MSYKVKINGNEVKTEKARVSAMPFNRRWPGHQRSMDQSEVIDFVLYEGEGTFEFEIKPETKSNNVVIRPASLNITPEVSDDGIIRFTLDKPSYFTVEPYGRQNALHVFVDYPEEYNINKEDENVLYFGEGEHNVGMINLKSNQTLFIDKGAIVYACVHAVHADNIKIIGRGILDNSRNKEQILFEANEEYNSTAVQNVKRLHTIQPEYCNNIEIEGITIRDSLVYNIRPIGCENLNIKNVKVIGCWRYNSDGIDMHNCINVNIENCFLRTFDDSICIKGLDCYFAKKVDEAVNAAMYQKGKSYDTFRNVRIRNCVIWNDWGKSLEIGAETKAEEICDIVFENCDIIHVTGAVLDCMNVDYANVHNVIYRNINIEYDDIIPQPLIQRTDAQEYEMIDTEYSPHLIRIEVCFHHEYSAGSQKRGKNQNMLFENIRLYGRHTPKLYFSGYAEDADTSDITIKSLYLNDKLLTKADIKTEEKNFCKNIQI